MEISVNTYVSAFSGKELTLLHQMNQLIPNVGSFLPAWIVHVIRISKQAILTKKNPRKNGTQWAIERDYILLKNKANKGKQTNKLDFLLTLLRPQKLLRFTWGWDPFILFDCLSAEYSGVWLDTEIPGSKEERISPIDKGVSWPDGGLEGLFSLSIGSTFAEPFSTERLFCTLLKSTFPSNTPPERSASNSSAFTACWSIKKRKQ